MPALRRVRPDNEGFPEEHETTNSGNPLGLFPEFEVQVRRKGATLSASGPSRIERPQQINTKRDPATPTKTVCTGYAKPGVSATSRQVSSLRLRAAFFLCSVDGASFCCVVVDGDHGDAGAGACGSITEPGVVGSVRRECRLLGSRNFSADGRPLVTQINCATSQFSFLSLSRSLYRHEFLPAHLLDLLAFFWCDFVD